MRRTKSKSLFEDTKQDSERVEPATGETSKKKQADIRKAGASRTISDFFMADAVVGVKESSDCQSLDELRNRLHDVLRQNSAETRIRNARFVIRWFFPDGFDGIARKTWMTYRDERALVDVLRYLYLSHEPVMGACVSECLFPIEAGMRVPAAVFDRFLVGYYLEQPTPKTTQRLKSNLIKLGLLERTSGQDHLLLSASPVKTSLLILTHALFAPLGPRTVELRHLFANPFWKYLGYKSEDSLRTVFREADALGILGKYVVADQLEQITTRWGLDEFLSHKPSL